MRPASLRGQPALPLTPAQALSSEPVSPTAVEGVAFSLKKVGGVSASSPLWGRYFCGCQSLQSPSSETRNLVGSLPALHHSADHPQHMHIVTEVSTTCHPQCPLQDLCTRPTSAPRSQVQTPRSLQQPDVCYMAVLTDSVWPSLQLPLGGLDPSQILQATFKEPIPNWRDPQSACPLCPTVPKTP